MKTHFRYSICMAVLATLMFNAQALSAQEDTSDLYVLQAGHNIVNVTVGLLDFDYMPPFPSISYERVVYQLNDNLCLGVGGTLGVTGVDKVYGLGVYALGNLHYMPLAKWDLFTGLDLGKTFGFGENNYYNIGSIFGSLVYPVHIGASYFFKDQLAATVRVGGWGGLSIGIVSKF